MSRRKQSNPKPLKRKADEELEELAASLQLPTDVLTLKEGAEPLAEVTVYAKVSLRNGTLFGPYAACLVPSFVDGSAHLAVRDQEGRLIYLRLKEAAGSWLKAVRLVDKQDGANTTLSLEDGEVWCNLTRDVPEDSELLAYFNFSIQNAASVNGISSHEGRDTTEDASTGNPTDYSDETPDSDYHRGGRESGNDQDTRKAFDASGACNGSMLAPSNDGLGSHDSDDGIGSGKSGTESPRPMRAEEAKSPFTTQLEVSNATALASAQSSEGATSDIPEGGSSAKLPGVTKRFELINGYGPPPSPRSGVALQVPAAIPLGHECNMCGIQFSSMKTLRAHQTYYCSRRLEKPAPESTSLNQTDSATATVLPGSRTPAHENGEASSDIGGVPKRPRRDDVSPPSSDASSTPSKSPKASRCYQCPFCAYTYDRKGSLTRHLRLHDSPPPGAESPAASDEVALSTPPIARYCSNCDIQFSSYKTFTVHKQYYCNTRHVQKQTPPVNQPMAVSADQSSSGVLLNQPLFAAISTNPLILVPCSYIPGNGLVPSTTGGVIQPAGVIQPGAIETTPAVICPPAGTPVGDSKEDEQRTAREKEMASQDSTQPHQGRASCSKASSPGSFRQEKLEGSEIPLDLSLRRQDGDGSPVRSPRPGSAAGCSVQGHSGTPLLAGAPPSTLMMSALETAAVPLSLVQEQVAVKQGTSRCRECNIVFYKHENYLAHKRHYCASRQQKLNRLGTSSSSGDEGSRDDMVSVKGPSSPVASTTSPGLPRVSTPGSDTAPARPSPISAGSPPLPQPMYQFYCLACGIKFTSLSNLQAHQTYYCPKRDILKGQVGVAAVTRPAEFTCPRCRSSYPTEEGLKTHSCISLRKCPYCDVFCPTQSAAQRHLVTHTGVKAFRCAICGYKGHTLRGMRTHVRIHLEKSTQAQEEAYIVCVGDDGNAICPVSNNGSVLQICSGKAATPAEAEEQKSVRTPPSRVAPLSPADDTQQTASARSASPPTASTVMEGSSSSRSPDIAQHTTSSSNPSTGEVLHWCSFCGYSSSYKGNVVRHVKLVHRDLIVSVSAGAILSAEERGKRSADTPPSTAATKIKTEEVSDTESIGDPSAIVEVDMRTVSPSAEQDRSLMQGIETAESAQQSQTAVPKKPALGPKYCKACDISFNYLSTFIAHKKYYCSSSTSEGFEGGSNSGCAVPQQPKANSVTTPVQ